VVAGVRVALVLVPQQLVVMRQTVEVLFEALNGRLEVLRVLGLATQMARQMAKLE
jgi:hypothetical protein